MPLTERDRAPARPGPEGAPAGRGGGADSTPARSAPALAALCLVAAAGAISLRERPFRIPAEVVVTTPEVAAPASGRSEGRPRKRRRPDSENDPAASTGPSIIKINPDDDAAAASKNVVIIRDPSAIGQNLRVAHLPDKALIEQSETGPLPIRAADGAGPFDVYARPWSGARGARVAIVIGGLGVSQTGTQEALDKLPPEVTLGLRLAGQQPRPLDAGGAAAAATRSSCRCRSSRSTIRTSIPAATR